MMRKYFLLLWCVMSVTLLRAQPYGNEWINYSQTYFKIRVWQTGIHRISFNTLNAVIPNLSAVNPDLLALYRNGQQVPMYVSATGSFTTGDFIEFYGEPNKGDVDAPLYRNASDQPHQYYNLFNDTAIYFLTISNTTGNKRLVNTVNDLTNLPPKENVFQHNVHQTFTNKFFEGQPFYAGTDPVYKSIFDLGEGWVNRTFFGSVPDGSNQSTNLQFTFSTPAVYGSGNANLYVTYVNNSQENHVVNIGWNNSNVYTDNQFGYALKQANVSLSLSQLQNNNTIAFTTSDFATSKRQNAVYLVEVSYPHTYDFENKTNFLFHIPADIINRKYIEITNFMGNNTIPVLYDLTNGLRIVSTQPGNATPLKFSLPPSSLDRELYVRNDDGTTVVNVSSLTAVSFINYQSIANQGDYLIITHQSLNNSSSGTNWVDEYRKYRDAQVSPLTGTYSARIYDIDQLYDQFAYGVRQSPLAIRNFLRMANAQFSNLYKPKFLFLIGKGREYPAMRTHPSFSITQNNNAIAAQAQSTIPTYGTPGSDNLFATLNNDDELQISVGRLAAQNTADVQTYLTKMSVYESEQRMLCDPEKIRHKQVLHFGGGTDFAEQTAFHYYLDQYKAIIQDTLWGANVTSYFRTNDVPFNDLLSQIIQNQIDSGVSLVTFFGHSSAGGFDISIDEPENYTNYGRYPVIISNGCFAGQLFNPGQDFSERFVLAPDKGSIAFLATSGLSVSSSLHNFTSKLYRNIAVPFYTQPFGDAIRESFNNVADCCASSNYDMSVAYEFTLHGDPALRLNQYIKHDFTIDASSVFFNPQTVTPGLDSFEVKVVVTNLGMATNDSFAITLKRTIFDQNNNPIFYNYRIEAPATFYRDTFTFTLPTAISNLGYGQNLFDVYVEADQVIDEYCETNNYLLNPVSVYIQNDDILPVYPYEFSIVPQQGVILKASTINPFAPLRTYRFQIDTTELFNSPILQNGTVTQSGGVVHWQPSLIMQDSAVYYWRVAKDTVSPNWHYSSFVYLANEYPGWNQSHYYQYLKDEYVNLQLGADRVFRFPSILNEIRVRTANSLGGQIADENLGWDYNQANMHRWRMGGCGFLRGLTFAIIDSTTGLPYSSLNNNNDDWGDKFGNFHCADKYYIQYGFDFLTVGNTPPTHPTPGLQWTYMIKNFIDSVPDGAYVLMYTTNNPPYTSWDPQLVSALQSIGFAYAQQLQAGTLNGPFMYFTQKGNASFSPFTALLATFSGVLDTSVSFTGKWNTGLMTSTKIGPAQAWHSIHWRPVAFENPSYDRDTLFVYGITSSGQENLLLTTTQFDNLNLETLIPALQYPYIRLKQITKDSTSRTPEQLYYWRVLYDYVPEAALNPAAHFSFNNQIGNGQNLDLSIAIENLTPKAMDSLLTKYTIVDAGFQQFVSSLRYDSLQGLDTMILHFNYPISGDNYNGLNKIIIDANPDNDQPEQTHFNNVAEINFNVQGDNINPLLDVTFDGRHIMNGDLVSAKPDILISLKDENPYLALNDTALIDVYLKYPNETQPRKSNYDNSVLTFFPASNANLSEKNLAQVAFKPELITDGKYELIIKDRDRSFNHSSKTPGRVEGTVTYDYKIGFEVINKPMITHFLNWPNPFTTNTHFVFTITGSQVPDFMKIQITTIRGIVVKEVFKDELGPLHVGENMTEYAWDGRDQYGDVLANGVYFYRVLTTMDGQSVEHYSQDYDKYFKKGFGKMVLVR